MYYLSKFFQALGLGILLYAFVQHFPDLMSYRMLGLGICIFLVGWVMDRYLLKR